MPNDSCGHLIFYLAPPWPEQGASVLLAPDESRHAGRVLRVRAGDQVRLIDGAGGAACGTALGIEAGRLRVRLDSARTAQPERGLAGRLALPWIRSPARLDWAVEKATELGVIEVHLFPAARSPAPGPARIAEKCRRWERVARAAMKQSGRAWCPTLYSHVGLAELLVETGSRILLVADPGGGGWDPAGPPLGSPEERLLLVGPEGGWSEKESTLLSDRGARRVALGPRRLRTETAAIVLCALAAGAP